MRSYTCWPHKARAGGHRADKCTGPVGFLVLECVCLCMWVVSVCGEGGRSVFKKIDANCLGARILRGGFWGQKVFFFKKVVSKLTQILMSMSQNYRTNQQLPGWGVAQEPTDLAVHTRGAQGHYSRKI